MTVLEQFEPILREALRLRGLKLESRPALRPLTLLREGRHWVVWRESKWLDNVGGPLFLKPLEENLEGSEAMEGAWQRLADAIAENWADDCRNAECEGRTG